MELCILKEVLGSPANIVIRNEECLLTRTVPEESWVVGDTSHPRCADTLCQIYGTSIPKIYSNSEQKTFEVLGKDPNDVPWVQVLGSKVIKDRIKHISDHLEDVLGKPGRQTYNNIYLVTRSLLGDLSPAHVCIEKLNEFIANEENSSLRTCLESFRPDRSMQARKVEYSQTSTTTGRLTVKRGPSILTLPAKYRSILKSRYEKGSIVSIDFKSLEPRVALSVRGKYAPTDVYTHIADNILGGKTTRSVAKIATIAALYGISFKKFKEMSGCSDYDVLDKVKNFFAVKSMTKNLLGPKFTNFWGRPLDDETLPHVRISHYIQSTSCDTVNVGFYNFLRKLRQEKIEFTPIFVLHDALILDVLQDHVERVVGACSDGIDTPLGNFPTTCEKF
tara:strand:- start:57 stop:1229 length:1173 start_codon:yes stop_codon:yes gene_type:complete